MNPLALLAAGALCLATGMGVGWTINGWRLDGDHQREVASQKRQYDDLAAKVGEQNRGIDALATAAAHADERRRIAERYAGDALKRLNSRSDSVAASTATDCGGVLQEAWGNAK